MFLFIRHLTKSLREDKKIKHGQNTVNMQVCKAG